MFFLFRTVWIYPYFDVTFPDSYVNLWCGFSDEQVFVIKNALRGSLLVGVHKGIGDTYEKFLDNYPSIVSQVTPFASEECHSVRFVHTPYMHDCIVMAAAALNGVVEAKLHETNTSISDIQVTQSDRDLLAKKLSQMEIPDGITGPLSFTEEGNRRVVSFAIMNFVPVDNSNFSVSSAVEVNPWSLETRAVLKKEYNNVSILFFTSEGEESSDSTIIFADGTSNIPPHRPFHLFYRSE